MINKTPLWRSTPPAIFPVALGFLGLALAWRNASNVIQVPEEIGDLLLGISTAFFLFFAISYVGKTLKRPKAILEDLKMPPARAGVAALPMAIMLLAAALMHLGVRTHEIWWIGVILFFVVAGLVAYSLITGAVEGKKFSPFQYLAFVGSIVAPVAGIQLGYATVSFWLALAALVPFVVITLGYGAKLVRVRPPVPLRPSLAIILAPTSLFAMAFLQLDIIWVYVMFYWLSVGLAVGLLSVGMWLTRGGWTPIWGSFTFPIATFANLQIMTLALGPNLIALVFLIVALTIGTPLILYIVWKSSQAWIKGGLAKKTAASVA